MKLKLLLTTMVVFTFGLVAQGQSTINITTTIDVCCGTEKWVSITDMADGAGTQIWGQGDGTYGNGQGVINQDVTLAPGTYWVNCYDRYDDSWDGTTIDVTAYGTSIGNNGGVSPDDGNDVDGDSSWETPADELEASFMIVVPNPPACSPPTSLTAVSNTTDSAELSWTASVSGEVLWDIELGAAGFTPTQTPTDIGVSNPFIATNLISGNSYDYYLRSDCAAAGSSVYTGPFTFRVPGFGDTCSTALALNVEVDCSAATPYTLDFATTVDIGTTAASCDTFGVNTGAWFEFTAPSVGSVIINSSTTMEFALFDTCGGAEIVCESTATTTSDIITGLTPGSIYKLVMWKDSTTAGLTGTTDICIQEGPTCLSPNNLSVSNITTNTAMLSWVSGGSGEASWDVELGVDGFTPTGTPTDFGVSNPFMATNLMPETAYDYYVRADCTGGDTSEYSGPYSFTTACIAIVPDYNADMSVNVPNCWEEADSGNMTTGPSDIGAGTWTSSNHNGTSSNRINMWQATRSDWIISPTFDLSTAAPSELNVYVALTEGGTSGSGADLGSDDRVSLLMTIDNGTTWTEMQAWVQGTVPTDVGEEITYDLSAITGNVQFAFLGDEGSVDDAEDVYFHVSKFQVREVPSCPDTANLTLVSATATDAIINFDSSNAMSAGTYEYALMSTATATPVVTGVWSDVAGVNPNVTYTIMGLSGNTEYFLYVREVCANGDQGSWNPTPLIFSTACGVVTSYPYTTDFTINVPNSCWDEAGNGEIVDGPSGFGTSDWRARSYVDFAGTSIPSNAINIFAGDTDREWLISEQYDMTGTSNDVLTVEVAVTNWNSTSVPDTMGSDDQVDLLITTDGGTTWTSLLTWTVANQPAVDGTRATVDLSSYSGTVQFAFLASDGVADDFEDYDFHVGRFIIDGTAGNEDVFENNLSLYPNPVNGDVVTINMNGSSAPSLEVAIYNSIGQQVMTRSFDQVSNTINIDNISSLSTGMYFVKVVNGNSQSTLKFIKE
ncbi:putative secreted protein (Por secretion system target) [Nonlabens xylanidelens]|uniref:Putative secreted protein (Por secretion system target) n=1 Tax=Nonlabens xylanidelens TaxID=191564 RepID=A0A2S6IR56_9FLAO|nr:T9SS type A sorting domain-containing protein [Nonlabens xylanidelens]PPK96734.1 putative secreted protein (Por secretion system target) [Nonlabens xylanidelens]PQJ13446.1 hypothetical protein BST94_13870 [Nonlabens xylanidelens]